MAKQQRDPAKERFWRDVLKRQAASGLSARAFCRREALSEPSFYAWRRTIGERDGTGNSQPAFVPAVIYGEVEHESPLVLKLAGDLELRLPQAISGTRLAELVRALEMRAES